MNKGPNGRKLDKAEAESAREIRAYADAIQDELERQIRRIPIDDPQRSAKIDAAIRRARARIARDWSGPRLTQLLATVVARGHETGGEMASAGVKRVEPTGDQDRSRARQAAVAAAVAGAARSRKKGTGFGGRALRKLPAAITARVRKAAKGAKSEAEQRVALGKARGISQRHGEEIGREETAMSAAVAASHGFRAAGATKGIWRTQGDGRVRPAHQELDGTIVVIGQGLQPGDEYGCRCWLEPILDGDDV